jgi:hypothetical protein
MNITRPPFFSENLNIPIRLNVFRHMIKMFQKKRRSCYIIIDNIPLIFLVNQWFQHDGASPHFSRNVQGILKRMYPNRWIGRGGPRH